MTVPIFSLDGYTLTGVEQYLFYFIIYSFLGWVLEGTYNLYSKGTFRKEGFMMGPFKPMYGFAPLFLLIARDLALPFYLFLLLALIIPSAVEFISGWLLKTLFHRQWWDYSGMRYQLQGHICLRFSLYWWVLSVACIYAIQPLLELLYLWVEPIWKLLLPAVACLYLTDVLWTIWTRRRGEKKLKLGEG
ncbi:MAG: putative ABC transporter permease [Paenibacillus sp.]|nr:putative ABC transporter permease [Paenibacillus sp.]